MNLVLYKNFSKRRNSTKQPSGGTTFDVKLKNDTTIENPTFLIDGIDFDYNYASFAGHYYFIDDMKLISNNLYEISCTQDELATYKSAIGSYSCFIERAANNFDSLVNDSKISARQSILSASEADTSISNYSTTGSYVVRVIGRHGILGYSMSESTLSSFMDAVMNFSTYNFGDLGEFFTDGVIKAIYNPFQYIVSVKWIPFTGDIFGGRPGNIYCGFFDTGVSAKIITGGGTATGGGVVNAPGNAYSDFRAYSSAWTTANIYLPGFGTLPLDPIHLSASIYYQFALDGFTGNISYIISKSDGQTIAMVTGNAASDVQLGGAQPPLSALVSSALGGGIDIVGKEVGGVIGKALSAVGDTVEGIGAIIPSTPNVNGAIGNKAILQLRPNIRLTIMNYAGKDFPTSTSGRPVCRNAQISSFSGFVKCGNASIDIGGFAGDKEAVNAYLNGGFYYE